MKFRIIPENLKTLKLCDIHGIWHIFSGNVDDYIKEINLYKIHKSTNRFEIELIYKDHCKSSNKKYIIFISKPYTIDNLPPYLQIIDDYNDKSICEQIDYLEEQINKVYDS